MKVLFKYIVFIFILSLVSFDAYSATRYSVGTGNWNSTSTWSSSSGGSSGASVPVAGDTVYIERGKNVTLTADAACASVLFTTSTATTLDLNGFTLTLTGAVSIPRSGSGNNVLAIGTGTLNAASVSFTSGGSSTKHQITISTGTLNVSGDITTDKGTSASIIFSGAGTLNAGVGIMTTVGSSPTRVSGGTLTTFAGATINYNGASQSIRSGTYLGNLKLSGTTGTKTFLGATQINGDFSILSPAKANLNSFDSRVLGAIKFESTTQVTGSWGSTSSSAVNKDDTYFTSNAGTIRVPILNTWNGNTSTAWETSTNWSLGAVPTSINTDSIVIPSSPSRQPVINAATTINSINILSSASLTISGTYSLTVMGNFVKSGTFSGTPNTVVFNGLAQSITSSSAITFNNLTLAGSGVKTFSTAPTVNGTLTMGGTTASISTAPTYVGAAGLYYDKTGSSFTAGAELKTTGTGGITIGGGSITQGSSSSTSISSLLTINSGATFIFSSSKTFTTSGNIINNGILTGGSQPITFSADVTNSNSGTFNGGAGTITMSGNFTNTGTFNGSSVPITIAGTNNQSIGGFSTTGLVSMTKTGGTATFTGNVTGGALTINGTGGTLNLGSSLLHTFTGLWTSTNGTLNGGSSTITFSAATVSSGTGGTFTANTGKVIYSANAAQAVPPLTYNNLTIGGSSAKTFSTTPTINGILSVEGTASVVVTTGVVTYGAAATLQYNKSAQYTATSEEWVTPFTATGGIIIANLGAITTPGAVQIGNNTNVPLTINSGATLTPGANLLTLHGDFNNAGTLTSGSGGITIAGTTTTQSIGNVASTLSTTGNISLTKTAGTATLIGAVNAAGLFINGSGGTLNLGSTLTHVFTGTYSNTAGTLNGGSSNIQFTNTGTVVSENTGTFTPSTGTVTYSGTNQTIANLTYNNLTLSGTGTKTYSSTPFAVSNITTVDTAHTKITIATGTYTTTKLEFNGDGQLLGTYGHKNSTPTYIYNFFNTGYGKLNVTSTSGSHLTGVLSQLYLTLSGQSYTIGSGNTSGTPSNITAGLATVTIHATDISYNTIASYTGSKTLTIKEFDATTNLLLSTQTSVVLFNNGVASGVQILITKAGIHKITIDDAGLYGVLSSSVTVVAGTATKLNFTAQPTAAIAGAAFDIKPQVGIYDFYDNITTSSSIVTLSLSGTATLFGTSTKTASAGTADFASNGLYITKSGTYTLTASAGSLTSSITSSFIISPATANKLAFSIQPGNGSSGMPLSPQPVVVVQDIYNNNVTGINDQISLSFGTDPSSGEAILDYSSIDIVNGVAAFNDMNVDIVGTGYTLDVISTAGYTHAVSNAFNITTSDPTQLAFTTSPTTQIAGANLLSVIKVQDANGNTITTGAASMKVITVELTSGSGVLAGTVSMTAVSGVADFSNNPFFIISAGSNKILTATATGLTSATSTSFSITSAAANTLSFTTQPSSSTVAGADFATQPVVTVQDQFGNTVTSSTASITLSLTTGTGTLSGTTTVSASSGVATFSGLNINLVGANKVLSASSAGVITATTSPAFSIIPAAVNKLAFTTQPSATTVAGTAFATQPVVTVQDQFGNTVTSSSAAIALTLTTGTGTLSGTTTVSASSGVATFSGLNINLVGANKVLTASTLGLTNATTSPAFSITPAAASKLVFTTQPSAVTIQNINFAQQPVVTVQDRFGNTVTSSSASIVLSSSTGAGTLNGTSTVSASSGVATFSGLYINTAGVDKVLTATSGALTVALSSVFTIVSVGDFDVILTPTSANCAKLGSVAVSITGGVSPFKYDWSDITGTSNDMNRVGLLSGTYTLTVTDASGVVNTKGIFVDGDLSNCTGQTVCRSENASAFSTDPDPSNSSYTWSILPDAGATFSGDGTSTIKINWTLAPVGVYSVCVTAHNICGTSTQTCKTVYVKQPNISAFADPTCSGANLNLHASGANNYSWLGPNAFSSNSANPVIYNATSASANGTYTLTATDANGCVASSSKTINFTVDPLPVIGSSTVNGSTDCVNPTGSITLSGITGGTSWTYNWTKVGSATFSSTLDAITSISTGGYNVIITNDKGCTYNTSFSVTSGAGPTVSASSTNVNCFGNATGAINLTATEGTSHSTITSYNWVNSTGTFSSTAEDLTGLSAGQYSVQVADAAGCNVSTEVTITQPAGPLSAEATITNINCKNASTGAITLKTFGGTSSPSYTYSWSGPSSFTSTSRDLTSLAAGTYTVTISDGNSCPYTNSYTITEPAGVLSATATLTPVNCFGAATGIVNLTATGGTIPYTYAWSKIADGTFSATTEDIAGLTAGTYSVTITDSKSCTVTPTGFVITQPIATLSIATPTITNVNCFGGNNGAFSIDVTGGTSGYTYVWSNGATNNSLTSLTAGTYTTTVTDLVGCSITSSYNVTEPAAALVATVSSYNDISCNGGANGAVNINVTGGTASYTYAWAGPSSYTNTIQNISSLSPGKYNLTVTDAKNCVASANQTLTQPDAIEVNATVTNNLCNGNTNGAITLNVSGGTGAYNYSWSTGAITNSITALSAGTYSVTVTDVNNCTSIQTYTITQPTALATQIASTTNLTCNGSADGAISLTIAGGVTPYNYAWTGPSTYTSTSKDISSLAAGTYTVTVTDHNGCTSSLTPTALTQPAAISATNTFANINCFGLTTGTINLNVSGGTAPYTYLWNDASVLKDRTTLGAGEYSVTIKDANSCSTSINSISLTQPAAALGVIGTQTNILCNGNTTGAIDITVTGGTTPYAYTWSKTGDGTYNKTTQDLDLLGIGTYSVNVVDNNACSVTETYTITQPTALATPIASTTNLTCNGSADGAISLTVSGGVSPYTYAWIGPSSFTSTSKDISSLAAGTYTVTVTDHNGCTSSLTPTALTQPTAITATNTFANINCFGLTTGTINLNVSGGTAPYTYLWNDASILKDRTTLGAGEYSVTIKDANSCSTSISAISITQPAAALSLTETKSNIVCNGNTTGSIDITIAGGSIPYTYVWSKTGDGTYNKTTQDLDLLGIGTYSVVVTDNKGCTISNSSLITQPTSIVASLTNTNLTCNDALDGAINLTIDGGVTPYTYAWTGPSSFSATTKDISGLAIGTYALTITDANNCSSTLTSAALTQPDAYSIKAKLVQNVNCYNGKDGSTSVGSIGGASPYAYSWSNGSSDSVLAALKSGKYVVNAIDANGCKAKDSISITQPANALKVYGNVTDTRACAGTPSGKIDVEVDNATGVITYAWTGPTSIGNIKSPSSLDAGDYTLSITDAAGCIASMSKTIGKATALTVSATGESKTCATLPDGSAYAVVTGGVAPYTYLWSTKDTTQSIKGLNTDTYTVQVTDANGCTTSDATTLTDPLCDLPVAVSDVFVSTNGTILTNSIAMNDSDPLYAATDLNFQLLNLPANNQGSIVASLNGDFVFTPTADYNGIVNLKYLVSNPLNLSAKATFRIYVSKIIITDTVVNSTCTAGGEINISVNGGFPGYTYVWTGPDNFISTERSVKALAPGSYEVSITDSVGSNITKTYLIRDDCKVTGSSTIYISGTNSYIYKALPQGPKTYTKHGSTGAVSFVYAGVVSTTYATSTTFPSMPGNYKAIATLAGDGTNTAATSTDFLFTIEKAPLTITANDISVYYGDPISAVLKAGTYSITGFVGDDSDSVITGKVTFATNYTDKTTSDEIDIVITPVTTELTADNYIFKSLSGNITIKNVIAIRPLPPKVNNAKYILGNIANPKSLRGLVSVIPLNTVPVWCDITTNLCDSVAPSLPTIVGKYVYALKSFDTLSHLYSAEYVYDTVFLRPPAPTVIDSTYIKGVIGNPINISIQVKGMYGSEINYFVNNIKQRVIPNLPSSIGVFNYTVNQIVNSIESDSSKFSITILNPNDIVHLQKIVDTGVLQTNSTFNFKFTFIVSNLTNYPMSHVVISDNLQNSVPITSDFNIISNKSSGGMVSNLSFNGSSTINLTDTSSKILSNKVDTSSLVLNIAPKGYVGSLTNVANVKVDTKWGTVNMISSADNKAIETTKRPTPYAIKDLQVGIPEGFSPNHDGVNDKFVVVKPFDVTIDLEVYNRWGNIVYRSKNYNNEWDGKGTDSFSGQDLISGGYYYIIKAINFNGGTKVFNGYIIIQR